jgi:hypothetical protein
MPEPKAPSLPRPSPRYLDRLRGRSKVPQEMKKTSSKEAMVEQHKAYKRAREEARQHQEMERYLQKKGFGKAAAQAHAAAAVIQASQRGKHVRKSIISSPVDLIHTKLVQPLQEAREDLQQNIGKFSNHMTFRLLRDFVAKALRDGVNDDPWLPHGSNDQMIEWVDYLLKALNRRLDAEDDEIQSKPFREEMIELVKLENWPRPPPFCRNPLWWARCKILYALDPADRNDTYKLNVPGKKWMFFLPLLLWLPPYWVPVTGVAWLVYWCCIMTVDDEYQLFSFVLRFKARLARAPRQQPARWPARPTPSHALAPRLRSSRGSSGA